MWVMNRIVCLRWRRFRKTAALMRFELERGNVDGFAKLLDIIGTEQENRCLSSNTDRADFLSSIEEHWWTKLVCGAGGGGFLQVILKKVRQQMVEERLKEVFMDSLVGVADCKRMGIEIQKERSDERFIVVNTQLQVCHL